MPTGKRCVLHLQLHLSDSLTSAGDSRHHDCKVIFWSKNAWICSSCMQTLHEYNAYRNHKYTVIDADALLDFWVCGLYLKPVYLSQNPSCFLRHSKESNHSESASSAPKVKGNLSKKSIYADETFTFCCFYCKKNKNVCYFTFTNTTALLPVHACVCFLILA